jgi:hypothetical protein
MDKERKDVITSKTGHNRQERGCVPCRLHSIVENTLKLPVASFRRE